MTSELDRLWRELEFLERRTRAPAPHAAHRGADWFEDWQARLGRVQRVRNALFMSGTVARGLVVERLSGIDISAVVDILLSACKEVALVWGGSVLVGSAAGGAIGFFGFGAGAAPGAVLGAGVGMQVGTWVLGLLGLKSLIEDLGTAIPEALRHYEAGARLAWGPVRYWEADQGTNRAPHELAEGHVILMIAVLTALTAYLTRGRGDPGVKARALQEIRASPRLGHKVADWVAANEEALSRHPVLKPKEQQVMMVSHAKPPAGPPMTPSQLGKAAGQVGDELPLQKKPELPPRPIQVKAEHSLPGHPNHVDGLPFSYKAGPFRRFVQRFKDEFSAAGYDDAQGFMQGSAASGMKHTGEALDARIPILPSDYDVAIVSQKLLQRASDLGIDVLHGPLRSADLAALGLSDAQAALSAASKYERPVNFKIYENVESVYNYDKTIPFSESLK